MPRPPSIADDLRWALDPAIFAREALGMTPDPWQECVLRWDGKRLILMVTRQGGKSTITSALAFHRALYTPDSLILLVSPSLRQSSELFRKVTGHLAKLETPPHLNEDNKLSLQLANGSRIVSLPSSEATIRGFSAVDLAIFDEDARVPDDLYRAVRPMLAVSDGALILMSTPCGKRGHFFETWDKGGDVWERVRVPATECPRISAAFLAEEQATMGELWFRSEYLCEFADTVDGVFTHEQVMGAFSDDVLPLFGNGETNSTLSAGALPPLFG
ncbi:MAG TPA: terminase family protein [Ktedonobacterales bacterium]|jgi:hypothetical protein